MNILDENIIDNQCKLLRSWRIPFRQIGFSIGRQGLQDKGIISLQAHRARASNPANLGISYDYQSAKKSQALSARTSPFFPQGGRDKKKKKSRK